MRKNKSGKRNSINMFLNLVFMVGAILGLTAFILHFTNKGGCGEGYKHEETAENCKSQGDECNTDAECCSGLKCPGVINKVCNACKPDETMCGPNCCDKNNPYCVPGFNICI